MNRVFVITTVVAGSAAAAGTDMVGIVAADASTDVQYGYSLMSTHYPGHKLVCKRWAQKLSR